MILFSSRRRHTRYWRDWSSDVCSSDLDEVDGVVDDAEHPEAEHVELEQADRRAVVIVPLQDGAPLHASPLHRAHLDDGARSEERRVGKECRSRWSPYP